MIPKCIENPCVKDNFVELNGGCYELNTQGPCPVPKLDNRVGINETSLEVTCTKGWFESEQRVDTDGDNTSTSTTTTTTTTEKPPMYTIKDCFIGGKRYQAEECPQQIEIKKAIESTFSKF